LLATIRRGGGLGSGSLSREADLCSFLLWALACGLGQAVAGGAESLLTAASAALSAQLHYVSRHARGLLEDAGLRGLLPGDALAVASLLLQEGLSWATACLEVGKNAPLILSPTIPCIGTFSIFSCFRLFECMFWMLHFPSSTTFAE
jgi:hypothetical protein